MHFEPIDLSFLLPIEYPKSLISFDSFRVAYEWNKYLVILLSYLNIVFFLIICFLEIFYFHLFIHPNRSCSTEFVVAIEHKYLRINFYISMNVCVCVCVWFYACVFECFAQICNISRNIFQIREEKRNKKKHAIWM